MKTANFLTFLLLGSVLAFGVTGCKKTPKSPTPIFGRGTTAPGGGRPGELADNTGATLPNGNDTRANPLGGGLGTDSPLAARPTSLDDYFQDRETFRQDTIYFAFDKYEVKAGELTKAQAVADYLKGQPSDSVLVEGHCDERGTPEYNRALGERRALSVRESLMSLGVAGDRIHTTTYGEDKPADPGHNEQAYAKNRRGEFVLLKPKTGGAGGGLR